MKKSPSKSLSQLEIILEKFKYGTLFEHLNN